LHHYQSTSSKKKSHPLSSALVIASHEEGTQDIHKLLQRDESNNVGDDDDSLQFSDRKQGKEHEYIAAFWSFLTQHKLKR